MDHNECLGIIFCVTLRKEKFSGFIAPSSQQVHIKILLKLSKLRVQPGKMLKLRGLSN